MNVIKKDYEFNKLIKYKFFILWTGNSFHLYLLLKKKILHNQFMRLFSLNGVFLKKWAQEVAKKTKINVKAGRKRQGNYS